MRAGDAVAEWIDRLVCTGPCSSVVHNFPPTTSHVVPCSDRGGASNDWESRRVDASMAFREAAASLFSLKSMSAPIKFASKRTREQELGAARWVSFTEFSSTHCHAFANGRRMNSILRLVIIARQGRSMIGL